MRWLAFARVEIVVAGILLAAIVALASTAHAEAVFLASPGGSGDTDKGKRQVIPSFASA